MNSPPSGLTPRALWLLMAAAVVPYLPSLGFGFLFDDIYAIVEHQKLHRWSAVWESLAVWKGTTLNYRPVRFASLAIDWNLGGGAPWIFHATNVALHGLCTFVFWRLLQHLRLPPRTVLVAAFLFAVHPAHVGAIDYISGRKDLLLTAYYLGTMLAFLRFRLADTAGRRLRWGTTVVTLGVLAAFTKESAITLPVILLLLDLWLSHPRPWTHTVRARATFYALWVLGGAAYVVFKLAIRPATKVPREQWFDLTTHAGTALAIWWRAAVNLVAPWRTVPDYQGMYEVGQGWNLASAVGLLLGLVLVVLALQWRRSRAPFTAAVAFWMITWIPTSGILPIAELYSEHYLYLPSVGFCLAAAVLMANVRVGRAVGAVCVLLAMLQIVNLGRAWATPQAMWETTHRINPASKRAPAALATIYQEQGRAEDALAMARRSAEMAPESDRVRANFAGILFDQGRVQEALATADRGLATFPESDRLHLVRAKALAAAGQRDAAIGAFARAANINPTWEYLGLWGEQLVLAGRLADAEPVLTRAVETNPNYSQAWNNLGLIAMGLRHHEKAEERFRRAVECDTTNPEPHNNLAVMFFQNGRLPESHAEAQLAANLGRELHPGFVQALANAGYTIEIPPRR